MTGPQEAETGGPEAPLGRRLELGRRLKSEPSAQGLATMPSFVQIRGASSRPVLHLHTPPHLSRGLANHSDLPESGPSPFRLLHMARWGSPGVPGAAAKVQ